MRKDDDGRKTTREEMSRDCMFFPKLGNFADGLTLE
jgi:hypothetical protein